VIKTYHCLGIAATAIIDGAEDSPIEGELYILKFQLNH
jgi:hypothetical protein